MLRHSAETALFAVSLAALVVLPACGPVVPSETLQQEDATSAMSASNSEDEASKSPAADEAQQTTAADEAQQTTAADETEQTPAADEAEQTPQDNTVPADTKDTDPSADLAQAEATPVDTDTTQAAEPNDPPAGQEVAELDTQQQPDTPDTEAPQNPELLVGNSSEFQSLADLVYGNRIEGYRSYFDYGNYTQHIVMHLCPDGTGQYFRETAGEGDSWSYNDYVNWALVEDPDTGGIYLALQATNEAEPYIWRVGLSNEGYVRMYFDDPDSDDALLESGYSDFCQG